MTTALLTDLMRSLAVLSMLLLLGTFLRSKVGVFQKVFLPASVIGGFIGLLLSPQIWGANYPLRYLQVTPEWVNTWSLLPGILIVPIFAAVPLGMFTNKKKDALGLSPRRRSGFILLSCGLFSSVASIQAVIGHGTNAVYSAVSKEPLYRTFGYELQSGFAGGHGTAGAVGAILRDFGEPYWELAQGVTSTTATVGLIGGMIIGILMINYAARAGKTAILKNPKDVPLELKKGFTSDIAKQASMGRDVTYSSSIEGLTVHIALILTGVGIGYYLRSFLINTGARAFTSLPVWFYGLFAMIALDFLMSKLGLGWLVDSKVRSKVTGTLSDIAIVSAIASIPIQAVMAYIVPIAIMCVLGFIATWFFCFKVYPYFYGGSAPFEHAVIAWGCGTGVMINGMMLLKICDPDYETPALVNFSMGFSLMGVIAIFTSLYTMPILQYGSALDLLVKSSFVLLAFNLICAFAGFYLSREGKSRQAKNA